METDPNILDTANQVEIIKKLSEKLRACYIFPEVAEQICTLLQGYLHNGEYASLSEANLFALALTMHMQEVNQDEHCWIKWHAEALPEDDGQLRFNQTWQEERMLEARLENVGFNKVERLPGNVGYLDIHYFHRPAWGGDTAVYAMNLIADTNALIIDLRQCTGGYPGMIALVCSYLFGDEPVHLESIYWRDEDITQQYWTLPYIPGRHYLDKPVYVLTSKVTFSGGEMFADIMQTRKRATIIGEKTDGGANPGASYRIHPHFEAFIPIGRVINPLTGSNWEGCGITPDSSVPPEQSFTTVYKLALQSVIACVAQPSNPALLNMVNEAQAALKTLGN